MRCKACSHPNRDAIDRQIIAGTPLRALVVQTGLSLGGLVRHKACIREALNEAMRANQGERAEQSGDLLGRTEEMISEARAILADAKASKDLRAATAAVGAITRLLELLGKTTGELAQPGGPGFHLHLSKTVNVYESGSEKELAELVGEATKGFSIDEFMRLRDLACNARATPLLTR